MQTLRSVFITLSLIGSAAPAFATEVKLQNNTNHTLCVAEARPSILTTGISMALTGWDCFEAGQLYALEPFDDATYLAVRDAAGNDVLTSQLANFPSFIAYVPATIVDDFRIEIVTLTAGGYAYFYYYGDVDGGGHYRTVSDSADLDSVLKARGFKSVAGRQLKSSDLPAEATLPIN